MSPAKITLSQEELELVNNAGWILTKNAVIAKVYDLFGQLSESYAKQLAEYPELNTWGIDLGSAKISKGEQYEGLPWVMLDHPRHFTSVETFAIRSFFWWGNHCSITLQLSGRFAEQYAAAIAQYFLERGGTGWFYCINENAWQHHFREDNYAPVQDDMHTILSNRPFIKIAKKIPLTGWTLLTEFFEKTFGEIVKMLTAKSL